MTAPADDADAHRTRCVELRRQGKLSQALAEITTALRLRPNFPEGWFNLAAIYFDQQRFADAVGAWRKAIELRPTYSQAYVSLSNSLRRLSKTDEAIEAARQAVELAPQSPDPYQSLATALAAAQRFDEAKHAFDQALALDPSSVVAHNNYGNMLAEIDRPAEAAAHFESAVRLDPSRVEVLNNLANVYKAQGKLTEAIDLFQQVLAAQPHFWNVHSNLLLTLNSHPRADAGLHGEHVAWAVQHAAAVMPTAPQFANARSTDRPLRIGYVSADFRKHSVAYFFEPIVQHHDRRRFEVFGYSNAEKPDDVTERIAAKCFAFRPIVGLTDEAVATQIRTDRIDILVDLSGHTANHRLLVFARRPAPIQATYLGYPNSTGLATMDYRLTDAIADPPGLTEAHHSETLIRLPGGFLCYGGPGQQIEMQKRAVDPDRIVFATFNNFAKVESHMMSVWAKILLAVPGSHLMIKAETLGDPQTQKDVSARFASAGVAAERLILLGREPVQAKHLAIYNQVDIGLDTFPYNGTTTTCEALWMGVPVITRAGSAHVSRVGASLLHQLGLDEFVAAGDAQYIDTAVALAKDVQRLSRLKLRLRVALRASPLMDAARFTRNLEQAYAAMWQKWIATK